MHPLAAHIVDKPIAYGHARPPTILITQSDPISQSRALVPGSPVEDRTHRGLRLRLK